MSIGIGRFNPRRIAGANLMGAFRPSRRVTLLATPRVLAGAAPPAVTFSGSLVEAKDVRFECTTGGARGSTVWRYSLNGGSTYTTGVAGAATITLSPTGIVASLPDTTYGGDEIYRGVISTILGPHGTIFDGASASESVRANVGYIGGRPTARGDGVTRYLKSTTSTLADAIAMGTDLISTIAGVARYNGSLTPTNAQTFWSFCNGSAGAAGFYDFAITPAGAFRVGKRGDTGGTVNVDGGTATNDPFYYVVQQSGTTASLRVNGAAVFTAQAQNVSAIAGGSGTTQLGHMSVPGLSPTEFPGDVDVGDTYFWNALLTANEITILEQALKKDWGL